MALAAALSDRRNTSRVCTGCDKPLPADAPRGVCPACLFRLALGVPLDDRVSTDSEQSLPPVSGGRAACLQTTEVGRYVAWEAHDRGGLGEVFKATDRELHRVVAVKRLQDCRANDPASQRRFLLEAEVTARLDHPGVVPVHSLFRDDVGRPCYTMRFIEGRTLHDALQEYHAAAPDPIAFRRLLQSFIQACQTVAYAHSRGIIHRDLTPRNIMLGKFGEAVVVDWGLAKVVGRRDEESLTHDEATLHPVGDSGDGETQMGSAIGTPAYMSPEQAAGRWDVIDAASDVYNLGAVLYALLTGRPPLESGNWPELQQKIQRGDFRPPRAVSPSVPRALEAVCLKAMSSNPDDRYRSARDLATEIELWLADEPVQACREPLIERVWRWSRKHRDRVAAGVSTIVAITALATGAWIVDLEKDKAELAKRNASYALTARISDQMETNKYAFGPVVISHRVLDSEIRTTLDRIAAQVGNDPRFDDPDLQPVRRELLLEALRFWDEAIAIPGVPDEDGRGKDGTWRIDFYRVQRALCLARLGEHEKAAEAAVELWPSARVKQTAGETAYDVARVYALCMTAAGDDQAKVGEYASGALAFLEQAADSGFFAEPTRLSRLHEETDLAAVRSLDGFNAILEAASSERRATGVRPAAFR